MNGDADRWDAVEDAELNDLAMNYLRDDLDRAEAERSALALSIRYAVKRLRVDLEIDECQVYSAPAACFTKRGKDYGEWCVHCLLTDPALRVD